MHFLSLTLLYGILSIISADTVLNFPPSAPAADFKSTAVNTIADNAVAPRVSNLVYQSTDGGQSWQDISSSLPDNKQPEGFFAGESDVYLHVNNSMYHSKSNLTTPVWEKETIRDPHSTAIAFNRSGVMAYTTEGYIYRKTSSTGTWMPVYSSFKNGSIETIFEAADGTVFLGCRNGLYKSADQGQSWKQVQNAGWVMDIAESDGVLIATGQKGIMRSADKGEHWEWVISEGGVGIAVEQIDGGFAAISYNTASKSRRVRISLDKGKTWQPIDERIPPSGSITSIKQMGSSLILSHPDGIFRSVGKGKSWIIVHPSADKERFHFGGMLNVDPIGDQRKVFQIYTSGHIMYAVVRSGGC